MSPEGVCEVEMAVALEDEPQAGNVALRIVDRRSQTAVENHVVVDLNQKQAKSGRKGDEKIKRTRKPAAGYQRIHVRTLMFRDWSSARAHFSLQW